MPAETMVIELNTVSKVSISCSAVCTLKSSRLTRFQSALLAQHASNAIGYALHLVHVVNQQLNLDVRIQTRTGNALGGGERQQHVVVLGHAQQLAAFLHHANDLAPVTAHAEIFPNWVVGHFQVLGDIRPNHAHQSPTLIVVQVEETAVIRIKAIDLDVMRTDTHHP